mgnify:CR=1 FL=1
MISRLNLCFGSFEAAAWRNECVTMYKASKLLKRLTLGKIGKNERPYNYYESIMCCVGMCL